MFAGVIVGAVLFFSSGPSSFPEGNETCVCVLRSFNSGGKGCLTVNNFVVQHIYLFRLLLVIVLEAYFNI